MSDYDLIVIGAGSGGVPAARRAAHFGAKVLIFEGDAAGGTCVNRGCVPKKLYVYASEFSHESEIAKGYGWSNIKSEFNWTELVEEKDNEIKRLNGIYERLLRESGIKLIRKYASFKDKNTVVADGKEYKAKMILIATGGRPYMPNVPGIEHAICTDKLFKMTELPKKIAIVGSGYSAVEFAGIFNGLGVETILLIRNERILKEFDDESSVFAEEAMEKRGMIFKHNTSIDSISKHGSVISLELSDHTQMEVDQLLYTTGRIPNVEHLGLEKIGVKQSKTGRICIDDYCQTSIPEIFAIGDVSNIFNLTPVAINEGRAFAETQFGNMDRKMDYNQIPSAVFSQPCMASVGLSEEAAREDFKNIDIYKSKFRSMKLSLTDLDEKTFMKLIVDADTDIVLGVHMVGEHAGEIIQGLAVAITCKATKTQFDKTLAIHPTVTEEFVTMREKSS